MTVKEISVGVVGAGITGLSAAHRLVEQFAQNPTKNAKIRVFILEANAHTGGIIDTYRESNYLLERGPDNFITNKPWALALVKRLEIEEQLIRTQTHGPDGNRVGGAQIYWQNRFYAIPDGFQMMAPRKLLPFALSGLISPAGKYRALKECFVPAIHEKGGQTDESLASFAQRRFGDEMFQKLIGPLIAGIYTADPENLSLRAALPQFLDMEAQYGSVIRAMRKKPANRQDRGVRYSMFVSFKNGMRTLIDALVRRILESQQHEKGLSTALYTSSKVSSIYRSPADQFEIVLTNQKRLKADHLIVTGPAASAGSFLSPLSTPLAMKLKQFKTASSAVVKMAFHRSQFPRLPRSFGFVVPKQPGTRMLALTFNSVKYAGRAPKDHVLLRTFWGGALDESILTLSDDSLIQHAQQALEKCLGIHGPSKLQRVFRYEKSMPQYGMGHLKRVQEVDQWLADIPNLYLAGNSYRGVGIPDCVRDGESAADQIIKKIRQHEVGTASIQ